MKLLLKLLCSTDLSIKMISLDILSDFLNQAESVKKEDIDEFQ